MLTIVAVAAAALLVPAVAAQAATISEENGATVYRGEGSEGISLLVSVNVDWQTQQPQLWLSDSGANRVAVLSGACEESDFSTTTIICPLNPNKPLRKATITVRVTVTPNGGAAIKDTRRLRLKR